MTIEDRLTNLELSCRRIERLLSTLVGENKPRSEPDRFMNITEASSRTGLSERTLRCYCGRGLIRHTKVGKRLIIHSDSLYGYIEKMARKTIIEKANELSTPWKTSDTASQ